MKTQLYFMILIIGFLFSCNKSDSSIISMDLIPFKSGDKWGYIDKKGSIIINPQFNEANLFIEDLALVKSNDDKFGFIGKDGKYIINATYKFATNFSEGLACVVLENGKPQFIDKKGNVKFIVNNGEEVGVFSEGLAAVKVGGKYGFIDKEGKMKINAQFDGVTNFNEGVALVGKINKEEKDVLLGFINKKGELVINYQFKDAFFFQEGLAQVGDGKKYGFIDKTGKYVINPQFDHVNYFKNSLASIQQGNMAGYIDKEGKIVINPQFKSVKNFHFNLAAVQGTDNRWGYIDKEGKYVINPQFEFASDFINNIAFVKSGEKWGIIDRQGKYVANPQFDEINFNFNEISYKMQKVESDYFDAIGIAEKALEGTDQKKFRGFNSSTTWSDLKKTYPDLSVDYYNWQAEANTTIFIKEDYINSLSFSFLDNPILKQKPVYRSVQKYDYWKGNYTEQEIDHYENIPNNQAKIKGLSFQLNLINEKSKLKIEQIFKELIRLLETKASLISKEGEGNLHNFQNEYMHGSMLYSESEHNVYLSIDFGKKGESKPEWRVDTTAAMID
jgi:hypothetical protein